MWQCKLKWGEKKATQNKERKTCADFSGLFARPQKSQPAENFLQDCVDSIYLEYGMVWKH